MSTRLLLVLMSLLLSVAAQAQDYLTKTNGEELQVKVIEINPTEVRYKRFDNPDGPLIVLPKSEVFMIRYASGVKEVFGQAKNPTSGVQVPTPPPPGSPLVPGDEVTPHDGVHLSGPRIGAALLTGAVRRRADEEYNINPFLTLFGWQFETRLFRAPNGLSGLFEFVPLIGGLEQGKFVPSLNGILGLRTPKGLELGMGPNITPASVGITLAAGATIRGSGGINFPINLAVVPGNGGARVSLLVGFTTRSRY